MRLTWLVLGIAVIAGGCYDPPRPPCGFRCGPAGECPEGYACDPDNRCHREDVLVFCDNAVSDGGVEATVLSVTCPQSPHATVIADGIMFDPTDVTIPVGGVVRFELLPDWNIVSPDDPGFGVGFGNIACLQFTVPRRYDYLCDQHASFGSVTVLP